MQIRFSFKHMETSDALISYAEEKIRNKIEKFSTKPIEAHVVFSVENLDQMAHCHERGGDGFSMEVQASCTDMYGSVDKLIDKLEAQLKKHKEKLKDHKHMAKLADLAVESLPDKSDPDEVPVDANDLVKFEKAKLKGENE